MRFLHLRLMLVESGIQSGSPSLVIRTFGNFFLPTATEVSAERYSQYSRSPRGMGTLDGWCHHSFASFLRVP